MRQIKFRAWHKPNKIFIPWEVLREMMRGKRIGVPARMAYVKGESIDPDGSMVIIEGNPFEHPDLVMQEFTGLLDKLDKEIYEGDVVKTTRLYGDKLIVDYKNDLTWETGGSPHPGFYFRGIDELEYGIGFDSCEVIGNVYEDPELFEKK